MDEHRHAFQYNNAMIRAFPMAPLAPLRGALKLIPPTWLLAAAAVGAAGLAVAVAVAWGGRARSGGVA